LSEPNLKKNSSPFPIKIQGEQKEKVPEDRYFSPPVPSCPTDIEKKKVPQARPKKESQKSKASKQFSSAVTKQKKNHADRSKDGDSGLYIERTIQKAVCWKHKDKRKTTRDAGVGGYRFNLVEEFVLFLVDTSLSPLQKIR
jgi:hypothetical protein